MEQFIEEQLAKFTQRHSPATRVKPEKPPVKINTPLQTIQHKTLNDSLPKSAMHKIFELQCSPFTDSEEDEMEANASARANTKPADNIETNANTPQSIIPKSETPPVLPPVLPPVSPSPPPQPPRSIAPNDAYLHWAKALGRYDIVGEGQ